MQTYFPRVFGSFDFDEMLMRKVARHYNVDEPVSKANEPDTRHILRYLAEAFEGEEGMTVRVALFAVACMLAGTLSAFAQTGAVDPPKGDRGRDVYQNWCAPCHSEGRGFPGTAALAVKYKNQPGIPAVLTARTDLTPQSIKFFVRQGVSVMPPFRKTEITDADLEAMTLFLTHATKP